jgi:HAD superfamily hydrolase (TIGR01509 family)
LEDHHAVVFDLDGTVIDSEPLHERTAGLVFAAYGMPVPDYLFETFKGRTEQEIVRHMIGHYAAGPIDEVALMNERQAMYESLIHELEPVEGVLPLIADLAETHRLALATSSPRRNQQLAFDKFGLDRYFDTVVTLDDVVRPKPDPEPYRLAAERLGVAPSRCLVFEDSSSGIRSALDAGCTVIALTTSFPAESLRAAGASHIASGFAEVREWWKEG